MDNLIAGAVYDPHGYLGAHPTADGTVIRTMRRGAQKVMAVVGDDRVQLDAVHDEGG